MDSPQGSQGCKKSQFFLQIKLLSFGAKIEPKLKKLQKTVKTEEKNVENACFLTVFQIFFNLGSILAHPYRRYYDLSICFYGS
jgi:hypothetical protein